MRAEFDVDESGETCAFAGHEWVDAGGGEEICGVCQRQREASAVHGTPCQVCGGVVQWHPMSDDFGVCSECGSSQDHPDLLATRQEQG